MTEQECLSKMIAPGTPRAGKFRGGVIQIHVTRACDKACYNCTQGSNLGGKPAMITPDQFKVAIESLRGYWGVVGIFGGNPAIHPQFEELCSILRGSWVPKEQRGLWCNNPITPEKAKAARATFNPAVSNLNVHLDSGAYRLFREYWPESRPFGLHEDSRHSPCYVAMRDILKLECHECGGTGRVIATTNSHLLVGGYCRCQTCAGTGYIYDEEKGHELISRCDINQHWSAMIGAFRGKVRAWFCEIAGAQAMLHQHDKDWERWDTGLPVSQDHVYFNPEGTKKLQWWELPMSSFIYQVRRHCHSCSVPLRGYGELAQSLADDSAEQVSETHSNIYQPKRKGRRVELITIPSQLGPRLLRMTEYLQNAKR